MRIFGGDHDYYDSVLAYGQDPNCIYKRKFSAFPQFNFASVDAELDKLFVESSFASGYIDSPFSELQLFDVLFCGKHYPGIQVKYYKDGRRRMCFDSSERETKFFYCYEAFKQFMQEMLTDEELNAFYQDNDWPDAIWPHWAQDRFAAYNIERHFNKKIEQKHIDLIHRLHGTPIYVALDGEYFINGPLSKIGFVAAVEPYTAFQELDMYISGVLGGRSPIQIEVDDIHRLEAKGFDKKTSFRRAKTKNR